MFLLNLLNISTQTPRPTSPVKTTTLKPRSPGSTANSHPRHFWTMAPRSQAKPIPRKTLTALDPVTLPIAASAVSSAIAAARLANVSGRLVPVIRTTTLQYLILRIRLTNLAIKMTFCVKLCMISKSHSWTNPADCRKIAAVDSQNQAWDWKKWKKN